MFFIIVILTSLVKLSFDEIFQVLAFCLCSYEHRMMSRSSGVLIILFLFISSPRFFISSPFLFIYSPSPSMPVSQSLQPHFSRNSNPPSLSTPTLLSSVLQPFQSNQPLQGTLLLYPDTQPNQITSQVRVRVRVSTLKPQVL